MRIFGFNFKLHNAGFDKPEHPSKALFSNVTGLLNQFNFFKFLYPAKSLNYWKTEVHFVVWKFFLCSLNEAILSSLHFNCLTIMVIIIEIQSFNLSHKLFKNTIKFIQPINRLYARSLCSLFFIELCTLPNGNMIIGFF